MDILFVTSDPALASAVKGTLESARHTVSAASDVDSLAGARHTNGSGHHRRPVCA